MLYTADAPALGQRAPRYLFAGRDCFGCHRMALHPPLDRLILLLLSMHTLPWHALRVMLRRVPEGVPRTSVLSRWADA